MIKKGERYIINDSVIGEVQVFIKDVIGNIIQFENSILKYSGMMHKVNFDNIVVQKLGN